MIWTVVRGVDRIFHKGWGWGRARTFSVSLFTNKDWKRPETPPCDYLFRFRKRPFSIVKVWMEGQPFNKCCFPLQWLLVNWQSNSNLKFILIRIPFLLQNLKAPKPQGFSSHFFPYYVKGIKRLFQWLKISCRFTLASESFQASRRKREEVREVP